MMREAGVIVKDNAKIQLDDPSEEDRALPSPRLVSESHFSFRESYHTVKKLQKIIKDLLVDRVYALVLMLIVL
jgi:hypothetical protein